MSTRKELNLNDLIYTAEKAQIFAESYGTRAPQYSPLNLIECGKIKNLQYDIVDRVSNGKTPPPARVYKDSEGTDHIIISELCYNLTRKGDGKSRADIGHELGHLTCHQELLTSGLNRELMRRGSQVGVHSDNIVEKQADIFSILSAISPSDLLSESSDRRLGAIYRLCPNVIGGVRRLIRLPAVEEAMRQKHLWE